MPSTPPKVDDLAQFGISGAYKVHDATKKVVMDTTGNPRLAAELGAEAARRIVETPVSTTGVVSALVNTAAAFASKILEGITQAKQDSQQGLHAVIAAALGDVLLVDVKPEDIPTGKGAQGQRDVNAALGRKFLDVIRVFFGADGEVTGATAERATEAFIGYCMQFSASVGFLGVLGEIASLGHIKELAEVGEMLEKSLGLGRLMRQVMAPYLQILVRKPLERKLNAQYRQDILGIADTVRASLMGKITDTDCTSYLAQHGYPDALIAAIKALHTPTHNTHEYDILGALNNGDHTAVQARMVGDGIPVSVAAERLQVAVWDRQHHLREAVCNEVLGQIREGFLPATAMTDVCTKVGLPPGEAQLWEVRAGYAAERTRKRLGKADMLFLYEHGQVTLDEVRQWAAEEGYSPHDQLEIELEFLGKTQDFSARKTAAAQRKAKLNPLGYIDNLSAVGGVPELSGWATDAKHQLVKSVTILSDGAKIGDAQLGRPRPDVLAALGAGATPNAGWTFSGKQLTPGTHVLSAKATDNFGVSVVLPHADGGTGVVNVQ